MHQFQSHPATLFLLMDRLDPPFRERECVIELHSQEEYDAIPEHWNFRCYGALYRLTEKSWFPPPATARRRFRSGEKEGLFCGRAFA